MLVLSRKPGEKVYIGDNVYVTVVQVANGKVWLGIEAPKTMIVDREEVAKRRQADAVAE